MSTATKSHVAVPASMLALGLALLMLATLSVVQTERMTVSPVQMDLTTLFEPKTGQLTFEAPPYCGRFDIFCFIAFIFELIFQRFEALFDLIFGGGTATAAAAASKATTTKATTSSSSGSTCASGKAGKACRKEQRRAERAQRRR